MAFSQPTSSLTAAEYLAWEAIQSDKHEYFQGEIFAMEGASRKHVTVSLNIASALNERLSGTPCRTYMADMKLQAHVDFAYFYPDVFVTCDPADQQAEYYMRSPKVVIEVLSPSTAAYDRGEKFAAYRQISSLEEFVLVDPDKQIVEHYRRTSHTTWELHALEPGQSLMLGSLDTELPASRIFQNLE